MTALVPDEEGDRTGTPQGASPAPVPGGAARRQRENMWQQDLGGGSRGPRGGSELLPRPLFPGLGHGMSPPCARDVIAWRCDVTLLTRR